MDQVPDYYAILHLDQSCTQDEIREQYKRMVKVFHPDHHRGDVWCEQQLRLCNKAYEILGDPDSRRVYELRLSGLSPEPLFNFDAGPMRPAQEDPSWTFNAPPAEEPQPTPDFVFDSPTAPPPPQASTQFDSRTIDATWLLNKGPEEKKKPNRSSMILVGSTLFAALIAGSIIAVTGDPVSSHSPPSSQGIAADTPVLSPQLSAITVPTPDMQPSSAVVVASAKKTSKDFGPYWTRYEMDQQYATRAIDNAGQKLHGEEHETLTSKSQALQQTSQEIQYKFDDLAYGTDNGASATAVLSGKLASFEQEIRDIRALSPQKQKPAQTHLASMRELIPTSTAKLLKMAATQPKSQPLETTAARVHTESTHTSNIPGTAPASPKG